MADERVKATIGGREALTVSVIVGDGVAAYWTLVLHEGARVVRRWEGRTDDSQVDAVFFTAGSLTSESIITWSVVVYGPARKTPYHVQITAMEGKKDVLEHPMRAHGEVEARKTATLSGSIDIDLAAT